MGTDVTWRKQDQPVRDREDDTPGTQTPGDTDAPDIVGPTGEEMPEATHDVPHHPDGARRRDDADRRQ